MNNLFSTFLTFNFQVFNNSKIQNSMLTLNSFHKLVLLSVVSVLVLLLLLVVFLPLITLLTNDQCHSCCTLFLPSWSGDYLLSAAWNQSNAGRHAWEGGQHSSHMVLHAPFPCSCVGPTPLPCSIIGPVAVVIARATCGHLGKVAVLVRCNTESDQWVQRHQTSTHGLQGLFHYLITFPVSRNLQN